MTTLNKFLNGMSIFLIIMPLFVIGKNYAYSWKSSGVSKDIVISEFDNNEDTAFQGASELPDIYYIILDGYGRKDILDELYNFDNKDMLSFLENKGFYIADKSHSNYIQTALSVSSSMNFNYLDKLLTINKDSNDRKSVCELIRKNQIVKTLKKFGYKFISISSGYNLTEITDADMYLAATPINLSLFHTVLINETMIPQLLKLFPNQNNLYAIHRERVHFALNKLKNITALPGPYFVFAHIICPHPPFVFDKNGNPVEPDRDYSISDASDLLNEQTGVTSEEYVQGYTNQLIFINTQIKDVVTHILDSSDTSPIILIQGDHGPGLNTNWDSFEKTNVKERTSIMNAYYFPNSSYSRLYDSISPVNTFRVLLNEYFGAELDILPDLSFYSTWKHPHDYILVSDD